MLIAIDHGNYAIKTPHQSFVSGLSEHTVKPPMADEILEYDGRYWTPLNRSNWQWACRRSITVYSRTNSPGISNGTALSNLFIRISRTAL